MEINDGSSGNCVGKSKIKVVITALLALLNREHKPIVIKYQGRSHSVVLFGNP